MHNDAIFVGAIGVKNQVVGAGERIGMLLTMVSDSLRHPFTTMLHHAFSIAPLQAARIQPNTGINVNQLC